MSTVPSIDWARSAAASRFARILRLLVADRAALLFLVMLGAIVLAAVLAPLIAPQNPYDLMQVDVSDAKLPPGSRGMDGRLFLLGSDGQGRDVLSAILFGFRVSLFVGLTSAGIAFAFGSILGVLAAYRGGWLDAVLMRWVDLQLGVPSILIALILLALFGRGVDKVVIALVVVQWAYFARAARSAGLSEAAKDYVAAAQGQVLGAPRIVLKHILPNSLPPLIVLATIQVASAIALEATLSFLGIGLPPTEPSLGLLIANGYQFLLSGRYWISIFPGVALLALVMSINIVGDRLRDVLNPRLAGR